MPQPRSSRKCNRQFRLSDCMDFHFTRRFSTQICELIVPIGVDRDYANGSVSALRP